MTATKDEVLARNYAAPYVARPDVWAVLVAPVDGFGPLLAQELGGHPAAWFAADVLAMDADRFGRALYQGVTVKAFGGWRVALWMAGILNNNKGGRDEEA